MEYAAIYGNTNDQIAHRSQEQRAPKAPKRGKGGEMMVEKRLYINGYDRTGTFRFGIANGESIPAGIIAGKGWTLKVAYEKNFVCDTCGSYTFEDGLCDDCKNLA